MAPDVKRCSHRFVCLLKILLFECNVYYTTSGKLNFTTILGQMPGCTWRPELAVACVLFNSYGPTWRPELAVACVLFNSYGPFGKAPGCGIFHILWHVLD